LAVPDKYLRHFKKLLEEKKIGCSFKEGLLTCTSGRKTVSILIPADLVVTAPGKLSAIIQSRLSLNKKIFARNCEVTRIDKNSAEVFLDTYHLMNATQSAFNYGLFYKGELLAVASFSKGRKMLRLPQDKRSFELIRFCCKDGITITGGLTKLVKHFCREKNAGDVMTYIDKQFSTGESFMKAGFKKHSETAPNFFKVSKQTFERTPATENEAIDNEKFILSKNEGNLKLVFTCDGT
jgi:hypothetical protein